MDVAWLLLPDFGLIALGWALCRYTPLDRTVWDGVERLVYFVLFPALLFQAIVRQPLPGTEMAQLAGIGLAITASGIVLALPLGRWPGVNARQHAAGAQTAFRFNTYLALALAERLGGAAGLAWVAVLISVCVPLCNVAAVWPLARQGGHGYGRELARNPLILATVGGLAFHLLGGRLPELGATTLQRIGSAALPLGLMAVGAGLRLGALREGPRLAAVLMGIRHLVLPAVAITLVLAAGLPPLQQVVIVAFAATPTAASAYVLATRMGGDGAYVAGLITLSTLLAAPGMALALAALQALR
ncbi:MAG: AEC family transporter [Aquabacterium sp.]